MSKEKKQPAKKAEEKTEWQLKVEESINLLADQVYSRKLLPINEEK